MIKTKLPKHRKKYYNTWPILRKFVAGSADVLAVSASTAAMRNKYFITSQSFIYRTVDQTKFVNEY